MIFGKKDSGDTEELQSRVEELEKQNKIMREALEFYANVESWKAGHKYVDADDATIFTDGSESGVTADKGAKAYRALEACK
jgi:cell shape-determining protein MreC